jgi:glycosyltransferase involved in cell wall biosynthesis
MGVLLGAGPVEPRLQALAEAVLVRGELPRASKPGEALAFSIRLARRFEEVNRCPGFLSDKLEWILKEHAKFAPLDAVRGDFGRAAARAHVAAGLARSGLIKRPARLLAQAALHHQRGPHPPCVLIMTWSYGVPTEVWIHRHATGLRRYASHVAAYSYVNRHTFRHPSVHLIDHPGRLGHRLYQLECAALTLRWPGTQWLQEWRLRRIVRKTDARVIHAHFLWNAVLAARVAETCGVPLVVSAHGSDTNRALVNEAYRESLRDVFRVASRVIAPSDHDAELLRQIGCPPEKVVRIYLGAPLPPEPAEVRPQGERIGVVCVARLSEEKGHKQLLEAFARAAREEPRPFLTLVGDGELRAEIESRIRHLDIAHSVRLTGWVSPAEVS